MKRIAIVGAGPAGCHLVHLLANTEHEILLFDHRTPYEKPCGGGLSPLVGQRFPDVMALPFPRQRPPRVILRASAGSQVEHALDSSNWAIVSRAAFGQAMLERALANSRVRHVRQRVTGVGRAEEGWSVRIASGETFSAEFLVGADGVRSIVRRRLVGSIPHQHLGLAVGYGVRGAPDAILFQSYADLEGYLWSFPRPACPERSRGNRASVGVCAPLGMALSPDLWQRVDRFLAETCPEAVRQGRYAALLPLARDVGLWDTPCAGPGWALLGDAAGHVHPLTGEGIAYALWSADLLAQALAGGEPMAYEKLWREHYGQTLIASGEMLCRADMVPGAYEMLFQLALAMAFPGSG